MKKEVISDKQFIAIIFIYIIGEGSVLAMGLEAENDLWLAIILSMFMTLFVVIIYARLHYIFPNKNLFDIIEIIFGKVIGKVFILFFTFYALRVTEVILTDYGQFITTVNLTNTPKVVILIIFSMLSMWIMKEGLNVIGRLSMIIFIISISMLFITIILLFPQMNINNILPVLYNGTKPVLKGSFSILSYPFGEVLMLTMVFSSFKTRNSPYKVYSLGILLGGVGLLAVSLTNLLVLGVNETTSLYYPTYTTLTKIMIGETYQRAEVLISIVYILGGIIKLSIVLLAACKGIAKLFKTVDSKFMAVPICFLIINSIYIDFPSIMRYYEYNYDAYPYYAFIFQVILPVILLITAEIKKYKLLKYYSHQKR